MVAAQLSQSFSEELRIKIKKVILGFSHRTTVRDIDFLS